MPNDSIKDIKIIRAWWFAIAALSALYLLLSELGFLPTDFAPTDGQTTYTLELLSVVLSVGGIWLALRLLSFSMVKSRIGECKGLHPRLYWYKLRLVAIGVPMWVVSVIYYSTSATSTPAYCLLIIYIAYIFCYPQKVGQGK